MDLRLFLEDIARGAGAITLKYFQQRELEIITKQDESPVTIADREAEQYIRNRIRQHFPEDTILGEEFGLDGSNADRRWILDPIDGTKSFIHGVPMYGVLIALEENGFVTHGVIHMPALNETVSAGIGKGCFLNGELASVSTKSTLDAALVLTTDANRLERLATTEVVELAKSAAMYRTWGDCYGHLLVATGRAEIMIDPKMAIWDAAALGVIVEEAGGYAFDLQGNRTVYGGNLVSCNRAIAPIVEQALKASGNA
jgi:histidinol phosphatase-like enzyme (inositol monophosphatase family)